ncbi:MAG: glycosyltransferase [Verrucomicrobia bacterium]|nr:glycosyltransferase [Verrucomicrobiota bacterium]
MKKISFLFLFFGYFSLSFGLSIHIYCEPNGKGLEQDLLILTKAMKQAGHQVSSSSAWKKKATHANINIFIEKLNVVKMRQCNCNWFIPNPECYTQDLSLLDKVDLVLCRTREVERIFKHLGKKTYFLGFTSEDCFLSLEKDYNHLLHLAGGSDVKGTKAILDIWNHKLPLLTVIKHTTPLFPLIDNLHFIPFKLPKDDLRSLQNKCGIHLCPSEVEGFGHSIMEALSTGAIVITTDAPPMNEFISDPRWLVPYRNSMKNHLGISYFVDPIALDETIRSILSLSLEELKEIGEKNRSYYLKKTDEFYKRLNHLLNGFINKNITEWQEDSLLLKSL